MTAPKREGIRPFYERLVAYINADPQKSVCLSCDLGAAGPGPRGQHDPDCFVMETKAEIDRLRAALEKIANCEKGIQGLAHSSYVLEFCKKTAQEALRVGTGSGGGEGKDAPGS